MATKCHFNMKNFLIGFVLLFSASFADTYYIDSDSDTSAIDSFEIPISLKKTSTIVLDTLYSVFFKKRWYNESNFDELIIDLMGKSESEAIINAFTFLRLAETNNLKTKIWKIKKKKVLGASICLNNNKSTEKYAVIFSLKCYDRYMNELLEVDSLKFTYPDEIGFCYEYEENSDVFIAISEKYLKCDQYISFFNSLE